MQAKRIQGMEDLFGSAMHEWQSMKTLAHNLFSTYGFTEIETPALEQVDTFVHGIGQSSDVVRKEMFRVFSGGLLERVFEQGNETGLKAKQRMALRPEGTAGVVRSVVENTLVYPGSSPVKLWYAQPMFRGERPQKGRLRQFHQIGVEFIGTSDARSDAEVILMALEFFLKLGFKKSDLVLRINSMGDTTCRPAYRDKVRSFVLEHKDEMCADCLERAEINPLRTFDCKNAHCKEVMSEAPLVSDNLCEDCSEHYKQVKSYLDAMQVSYVEDPTLVRGLDYYTRTVFEIECPNAGVGALGGGGRYDGLVELCGGKPTPAVGFALGYERIMLAMNALGIEQHDTDDKLIYLACVDASLEPVVFELAQSLREQSLCVEYDYQGRSLKSQFKQADKLQARTCVVVGPDELERGEVLVRDMQTHEQMCVKLENLGQALLGD